MLNHYLTHWRLRLDGESIVTHSSRLWPVRCEDGAAAMLKIATEPEEKYGAGLMLWWNGNGAARVLAHDDDALLLERAEGHESLIEMAQGGRDETATQIICEAIARLHTPRETAPPQCIPLTTWFAALQPAAAKQGKPFTTCAALANELLASPQDETVLHGDIHHGNILDFGARGWLAIDPKRLHGSRAFDYANLFCNPDLETAQRHFHRRLEVVTKAADFERTYLLKWIAAYAALSAAWSLEDGGAPEIALTIAGMALEELGNGRGCR